MFRTVLSLVAVTALVAGAPHLSAQAPTTSKATSRSAGKPALTTAININTAAAAELDNLPGIGAKTAARIVEYRQKNGPFKKIEEILETSRSCRCLLSISRLSAHRTVARNR